MRYARRPSESTKEERDGHVRSHAPGADGTAAHRARRREHGQQRVEPGPAPRHARAGQGSRLDGASRGRGPVMIGLLGVYGYIALNVAVIELAGTRPLAIRGRAPAKPKPLLITETFLCVFLRMAATDGEASDASVVKTNRAASAIRAGWIKGPAIPEMCDQNALRMAAKSARARHSNIRG